MREVPGLIPFVMYSSSLVFCQFHFMLPLGTLRLLFCILLRLFLFHFMLARVSDNDTVAVPPRSAGRLRDIRTDPQFSISYSFAIMERISTKDGLQRCRSMEMGRLCGHTFLAQWKYCSGRLEKEMIALGYSWCVYLSLRFALCLHSVRVLFLTV